jgi:hypothetical protein
MRIAVWWVLPSVVVLAGCGYADLNVGPIQKGDRDAGTDAGELDAGEVSLANADCLEERECVPQGAFGWSLLPYLMWIGPKGQAPAECPDRAEQNVFHGYGNLVASDAACESCTCETSTGSCEIPTGGQHCDNDPGADYDRPPPSLDCHPACSFRRRARLSIYAACNLFRKDPVMLGRPALRY